MKRFWIAFCILTLCVVTVGCKTSALPSDFSVGTFSGQMYENPFIGLGCKLPDDFTLSTVEELADTNDIATDLPEAQRNQKYAEATTLYLMQANNVEGGGVGINLENTEAPGAEVTSAKQYLAHAKAELPSAMESMGFTDVTVSEITLTLAGTEYNALQARGNIYEEAFCQNYVCYEVDKYLVIVSYGAYSEDTVQTLTDSFYTV